MKRIKRTFTPEERSLVFDLWKQGAGFSDNGPEYISYILANWAKEHDIELLFIQPGDPQQNAYVERFNRTVRYDWLAHYLFESIEEVEQHATNWLWTYNHERPNMGIGGITPKQKQVLVA